MTQYEDLEHIDHSETPKIGELVFCWSLYEERWRPYQVASEYTKICKISKVPIWSLLNLDTGFMTSLLVKHLRRSPVD